MSQTKKGTAHSQLKKGLNDHLHLFTPQTQKNHIL